jgi:ABC-2 type transport system ATP-binding protein
MTQLSVARGQEGVASAADRIRDAIEQGQQETAKRLLLDYAREAGCDASRDEALILASRLATATREQDTFGKDTSAELAAINMGMLALLRRIETAPQSSGIHRLQLAPEAARPSLVPSASAQTKEPAPTPLEKARLEFSDAAGAGAGAPSATFACEQLGKRYRRAASAFTLRDVAFSLRPGEILGLVGENGAGKTTLLRIVAGEILHSEGSLSYPALGSATEPLDWANIRPQIAYVSQSPTPWHGRLRTTLQLVAALHGYSGRDNEKEVDFWLHRLGLERFRDACWDELSGGYKTRFELARAMLCKPKLLILDEPLAPLDIIAQRVFLQDLSYLAASRRSPLPMLVSSQHLYEIELIAHQLLFLRDGKVAYLGPPNAFHSKDGGNLFEIACNMNREQLLTRLLDLGQCRVEEFGRRFLVRTPDTLTGEALLTCIAAQGAQIDYFHDLTHSTRRLFEEGRRHG